MMSLSNYRGKNDYFHITRKQDFDAFISECLAQGITAFSSGAPLDADEYYNHDDIHVKIKSDGTVAFMRSTTKGRVHEYVSGGYIPTPKAARPSTAIANSAVSKGGKDMKFNNLFKGMGFDLVKTSEFGIDLLTGKLAFIGKDKATIIDGKRDLTETMPDMVKSIPLMCIPTPVNQLKVDDIIKRNNKYGVVTAIDGTKIQIQNYSGTVSSETVAKHVLTQTAFVPKLFNPFEGLGAGTDGQMNPMMSLMFLGGDDGLDDDLLPIFMLMQAGQSGVGTNPQLGMMLPMLLAKDGGQGSIGKMFMLQAMMGQGTAGAVANPLAANPLLMMAMCGGDDCGFGGGSFGFKEMMLMQAMTGQTGGLFGGFGAQAPAVTTEPEKANV